MFRKLSLYCLILWLPFFLGCSTLSDAKMARGKGSFVVYDAPIKKVWQVVIDSINTTELQLSGESKEEGYILAARGVSFNSYGENVAIFINSINDNKTRVEIVSKKVMATNIFAVDWSKRLFEAIGNRLKNE